MKTKGKLFGLALLLELLRGRPGGLEGANEAIASDADLEEAKNGEAGHGEEADADGTVGGGDRYIVSEDPVHADVGVEGEHDGEENVTRHGEEARAGNNGDGCQHKGGNARLVEELLHSERLVSYLFTKKKMKYECSHKRT